MKKVRGWKRRVKRLKNLVKENEMFDLNILKDYGADYMKTFNFHDIEKIPEWYKKEFTLSLLKIYDSWKECATKTKLTNCHLRLHIHEDNIFDSQIMIINGDLVSEYKSRIKRCDGDIVEPLWLLNQNRNFTPYYTYSVWLEEELDTLSSSEKDIMLSNVVEIRKDGLNEKEYLIKDGIVWCIESDI
ncbi:hypothetical protein QUF51_02965 [Bacillus pumilus]|nr:hypothetical protein [Bacillus pumilus]OLP64692.1 hypothetical protein BACPU_22820 [Bacillus pumilus]